MEHQITIGFKRIFLIPTIVGIFPFTFTENTIRLNPILVAYGLILRIWFANFSIDHILRYKENVMIFQRQKLYFVALCVNIFLTYMATVVVFILLLFQTRRLKIVFSTFIKIDMKLYSLSVKNLSGFKEICYFLFMVGSLIPGTMFAFFTTNEYFKSFSMMAYLFYLPLTGLTAIDLFVKMIDIARVRFRALKDICIKLPPSRRGKQAILHELLQLHSCLCNICSLLNECFDIQLVIMYLVVFCQIVTAVFYILHTESFDGEDRKEEVQISKALLAIIFGFKGYIVIYMCNNVSRKAKEFNNLLYQMMSEDKMNDLSTDKKLRLHISMKREVVFTACGFFTVDNSLIHKMIAAATTYLVILLQFGDHVTAHGNITVKSLTTAPVEHQ